MSPQPSYGLFVLVAVLLFVLLGAVIATVAYGVKAYRDGGDDEGSTERAGLDHASE